MSEQSPFDDSPPIDVARFHPSIRERLLDADHALGVLEAGATHARNHVRSDDVAANEVMLANITVTLGECVKCAEALHGDFAEFEAQLRERPAE